MNRIAQTAFPARYIQGPGAIKMLPSIVSGFGTSGLLIVDPFVHDHILPSIDLSDNKTTLVTEVFGGECTEEEIQRLVDSGKKGGVGCVVGLGGGKVRKTVAWTFPSHSLFIRH
jgi:glycerol dehydrogenase